MRALPPGERSRTASRNFRTPIRAPAPHPFRHPSGMYAAATRKHNVEEFIMFSWAIAFFVIALIAAIFGFGGLAASAAGIAKIIFVVALILAAISFFVGRRPAV
jgi:uncharacterized membrane protein YtjA (UPF0391 family)